MRLARAVLFVAVAACGRPNTPPAEHADHQAAPDAGTAARPEVPCGDHTCGPDEYCEQRCLCCGAYIADPSRARSEESCKPLPDSCKTGNGPECQQRTVAMPCA